MIFGIKEKAIIFVEMYCWLLLQVYLWLQVYQRHTIYDLFCHPGSQIIFWCGTIPLNVVYL